MKRSFAFTMIAVAAALVTQPPSLHAAEYFVAQAGQTPGDYTTWETASSNIAAAVYQTTADDTVWVSNGTYLLDQTIIISNAISLRGTGGTVTLDGGGTVGCLDMPDAAGTIAGLTIINGYTAGSGGGLSLRYGTVTNCVFSNNTATAHGGGVYAGTPGTTRFYDSRFVDNHAATNGGGVYAANAQEFHRCDFTNNTAAANGGGLFALTGALRAYDCEFRGNHAVANGGGTYAANVQQFHGCLFETNTATGSGGGLYHNNGSGAPGALVTNCIFRYNVANYSHGGLYVYYTQVRDCTAQSNAAVTGTSGGIGAGGAPTIVDGCLITHNKARTGGGASLSPYSLLRNSRIAYNESTYPTPNYHTGAGGVLLGTGGKIHDCLIEHNTAPTAGGGGMTTSYSAIIRNCLFRHNSAAYAGAVSMQRNGTMENCTIVGNAAGSAVGGVYMRGNDGGAHYFNNILYGNTGGTSSNYYIGNLRSISNNCVMPAFPSAYSNVASGNVTADPRFVNPANDDFRLRASSPCFNTGLYQDWMEGALDLDEEPRIRYGQVDMGCYEAKLTGSVLLLY